MTPPDTPQNARGAKHRARLIVQEQRVIDGKWAFCTVDRGIVRVLCKAEGYAMVRFPRAVPFVVSLNELHDFGAPDAADRRMGRQSGPNRRMAGPVGSHTLGTILG